MSDKAREMEHEALLERAEKAEREVERFRSLGSYEELRQGKEEGHRERDKLRARLDEMKAERDEARAEVERLLEGEANREAQCRLVERLEQQLNEARAARFAPMGDNHHNAAQCPYCGDPLRAALEECDVARVEIECRREETEEVRAQLRSALRDLTLRTDERDEARAENDRVVAHRDELRAALEKASEQAMVDHLGDTGCSMTGCYRCQLLKTMDEALARPPADSARRMAALEECVLSLRDFAAGKRGDTYDTGHYNLARHRLAALDGAAAAGVALAMYIGEPCRVCGLLLTRNAVYGVDGTGKDGAVYAGQSKCNKARAAHTLCWVSRPSDVDRWAYP